MFKSVKKEEKGIREQEKEGKELKINYSSQESEAVDNTSSGLTHASLSSSRLLRGGGARAEA